MKNFKIEIIRNYGSSLGAAIRNSIDPNEPSIDHYLNESGSRLKEVLLLINQLPLQLRNEGFKAMINGIIAQTNHLFDGTIDRIRDEIKENEK